MHTDVKWDLKPWQDDQLYCGQRLVTYMLYLNAVKVSSVTLVCEDHCPTQGGRTVFTAKRVSQEPVEGDIIFWFNIQSDGGFDSRAHHMGCPVVAGSKWIANKWVRWRSQMWAYPCLRQKGRHYQPFSNYS